MAIYDIDGYKISSGSGGGIERPHEEKKCLCIGDSNMQFMDGMAKWTLKNLFSGIGMDCVNYAQSGSHWYYHEHELDTTDHNVGIGQLNDFLQQYGESQSLFSMVLFLLGTNDHAEDLGNFEDAPGTRSTVGYMRYTIEKILSLEGFKKGRLFGIIPARRYDGIETLEELQSKVDMIKRVYEDYSIPYVDLFYASNIRQADLRDSDKVHLLEEAYEKMTLMVRSMINSH